MMRVIHALLGLAGLVLLAVPAFVPPRKLSGLDARAREIELIRRGER